MENRATALLHEMLEMQADWLRRLGTPPLTNAHAPSG
jgi:hypothetical protein